MALIPEAIFLDTCFIGNWLIVAVGFTVDLNNICLEPISKNSVFVIFKVLSLLAASHTQIPSKSRLTMTIIHFISIITSKSNTSIIGIHSRLGMLKTIRQIIYI